MPSQMIPMIKKRGMWTCKTKQNKTNPATHIYTENSQMKLWEFLKEYYQKK